VEEFVVVVVAKVEHADGQIVEGGGVFLVGGRPVGAGDRGGDGGGRRERGTEVVVDVRRRHGLSTLATGLAFCSQLIYLIIRLANIHTSSSFRLRSRVFLTMDAQTIPLSSSANGRVSAKNWKLQRGATVYHPPSCLRASESSPPSSRSHMSPALRTKSWQSRIDQATKAKAIKKLEQELRDEKIADLSRSVVVFV
jgi:hypothetical protein